MEMQLVVAVVAQVYRLHLVPGQQVEPEPSIAFRPRPGILMALHRNPPPQDDGTTVSGQ
jgi:hypothetical protein